MTFAVPFFLLAALAAAIPLVLHMIHRQKAKELPFSTLRFLRLSVQKTRRRKYIDDVSLLLARMAVLVLIALGLSKPALNSLRALWGRGRSTAAAIILDNSASMAALDGGQPRFETARHEAELLLGQLHEGDPVALFLTGGAPSPEQGRFYHTLATIQQSIVGAKVSNERADLAGKLQQARALLDQSDSPNKEIYVITDNQAHSWEGLKPAKGTEHRELPVVLIDVTRDAVLNAGLRNLHLQSPAPVAGVPVQVGVELVNTSTVPQQKHLELLVDGSREASSPMLTLPPLGSVKHEFRFTPDRAGVHKGEVKIAEDDGLPLDNQVFFAAVVDQSIPVAIVKPRKHEIPFAEETFYLERALAPGGKGDGAVRATPLTPQELAAEPLTGYAVIFCVDLPALEPPVAERLRDYARGGGHLFWICGPNVVAEAYNRMNTQASGELLPAALEATRQPTGGAESWHIGTLDKDDTALGPLTEPAALYQSVLVYKHVPQTTGSAQEGVRVLARLDDNQPLLTERAVGAGSVLMLGTGVTTDWTSLPLKPLFLPMVARLTFRLAGAEADRSQTLAGAPVTVPLGSGSETSEVEVIRPSGETLRLHVAEKEARSVRYADTHDTGVYLFRSAQARAPKQTAVGVNVDPAESDPAALPHDELKQRLGTEPLVVCDNLEDLAGLVRRLREGKSLWEWFLAAVLVALVGEAFLANRKASLAPGEDVPAARPDRAPAATAPAEPSVAELLSKV